jgi:hypothetical protein
MLQLGFEPRSLMGLYLPPPPIRERRAAHLDPEAEEARAEDSCDVIPYGEAQWECRKQVRERGLRERLAPLDSCRRTPSRDCLGPLYGLVEKDLKTKTENGHRLEALDSMVTALLGLEGEAGYRRVLAMLNPETQVGPMVGRVLNNLVEYRLERAYRNFLASQIPYRPARSRNPPGDAGESYGAGWDPEFRRALEYRNRILEPARAERRSFLERPYKDHLSGNVGFLKALESGLSRPGGIASDSLLMGDARLLSALERGDLPAALLMTGETEKQKRMLESRGLDWEAYFLGGVAEDMEFDNDPGSSMAMDPRGPSALC